MIWSDFFSIQVSFTGEKKPPIFVGCALLNRHCVMYDRVMLMNLAIRPRAKTNMKNLLVFHKRRTNQLQSTQTQQNFEEMGRTKWRKTFFCEGHCCLVFSQARHQTFPLDMVICWTFFSTLEAKTSHAESGQQNLCDDWPTKMFLLQN